MAQHHHFALSAALFLLLSLAADASIYRTVVTTEVSQDTADQMPQQCVRELMQVDLTPCKNYIRQQVGTSSVLETTVDQGRQVPQRCCQQIRQLSEQCRCPAVGWAAWDAAGGYQGGEAQQALQAAERLTGQCNVSPRRCEFRQQS